MLDVSRFIQSALAVGAIISCVSFVYQLSVLLFHLHLGLS